jgi:hypothetical protein
MEGDFNNDKLVVEAAGVSRVISNSCVKLSKN